MGKMGSICRFSRALPASIWGRCSQIPVFTSIWGTEKRVRQWHFPCWVFPASGYRETSKYCKTRENAKRQIDPPPPTCTPSPEGPTIKKNQSRSKFSISIENFNLARKFQSRRLDFPTKNRAAVGGSLENLILARNFQSRSEFWSLGPLGFSLRKSKKSQNSLDLSCLQIWHAKSPNNYEIASLLFFFCVFVIVRDQ